MSNALHHPDASDATGHGLQPVIPLAYETSGVHPLASAARGLGLVLVVLGAIHVFIMDPLSVFVIMKQQSQYTAAQRSTILAMFAVSLLISLVLNAVEIGVGIAAIRRRPSAVRGLYIWAWCAIGYVALGSVVNIWYQFSANGTIFASYRVYVICYVLEQWLRSLTAPLVSLMLLRSRSFRSAFTGER